jgi:exoribonuclease R
MSLVQGKLCPALSFGVILDETGAIADYRIHPRTIKPTYRLTLRRCGRNVTSGFAGMNRK